MIRVLHGDMRDVLMGYPDNYFDAVIADPPYGETSLRWDTWPQGWPGDVLRVLKPTGSMWVFGSLRMFMERASELAGWRMSHDVVWRKQNGSGFQTDRFRRVHELVAHYYRADAKWGQVFREPQFSYDALAKTVRRKTKQAPHMGQIDLSSYETKEGGARLMQSVIEEPNCHGYATHPTQKPDALVEILLRYACPPGGRVLDPFAGSGTTGRVASSLGLDADLIEADPDHFASLEAAE